MYFVALIIIVLIFIWRIAAGFKKGMVHEVVSLIAMVVAGFCMMLIFAAVESYFNKEMGQLIQFILVLLAVCVVYRLINTLFTSLQLISKLPIIKGLDKILGAAVGLAEAGILVGILVYVIKNWGLSQIIH